jgi:methylthioribose-1-phosphate isomerase
MQTLQSIELRDGQVWIIDQTLLPGTLEHIRIDSVNQMFEAIQSLRVRGAPAIGVAAAFGVWIGVRDAAGQSGADLWPHLEQVSERLISARPTAVNLAWAINSLRQDLALHLDDSASDFKGRALSLALDLMRNDVQTCIRIGEHGAALLHDGMTVLTHCNAGGMATVALGTALAPIYVATQRGQHIEVFADETRPLMQGSRLTAYELSRAGIPVTIICDSAAPAVMQSGRIEAVFVGADRVAANGDVANKIGTYGLALAARAHNIPFYVAAPISTIDFNTASGSDIVIEERSEAEVLQPFGQQTAPEGVRAYNPAFDVTPAHLVTALITEQGILRGIDAQSMASLRSKRMPVADH